jgi:D-alanyl-D-alanine carboxypeptidase
MPFPFRSVRGILATGAALVAAPALAGAMAPVPPSAVAPAVPQDSTIPRAALDAVDSVALELVERGITVGAAVGIAHQGRVIHARGYGLADAEHEVPATERSIFRIGSVTKQMTAAALLRLEADGALSLDDDVTLHLPEAPVQDRVVTLRQLLNHTSGMKNYTATGARWLARAPLPLGDAQILELVADEPFDFEPGEGWAYSNTGYYLAGMVVARVTGQPLDQALRELLFGPMGLEETLVCPEDELIPHRARGYQHGLDGIRNATHVSMRQAGGAGSVCASVRDLVRWDLALRGGSVLPRRDWDRMVTPRDLPEGAPPYGLGILAVERDGVRTLTHSGGIQGYNAVLTHLPEHDLTVAVLTNLNGPGATRLEEAAVNLLLAALTGRDPDTADAGP